jgi:hypothetical protein
MRPVDVRAALVMFAVATALVIAPAASSAKTKKPSYRLGKLREGMPLKKLVALLGKPKKLSKVIFEGATGLHVRDASYPQKA